MADILQPTNRYVHFPAELIPSDRLAYMYLVLTQNAAARTRL